MERWVTSVVVGVVLVLIGAVMMRSHRLVWSRQKNNPSLDDEDRQHYYARFRRRTQTSRLIAIIGLLLPLGGALLPMIGIMQQNPMLLTVYWTVVLVLTLWVIVLALSDLMSVGAHSRAALARVRLKQRDLEQEAARIKSRGSNGHPSDDSP